METGTTRYTKLARQELDLVQLENYPSTKIAHLNLVAQHPNLADRRAQKSFEYSALMSSRYRSLELNG